MVNKLLFGIGHERPCSHPQTTRPPHWPSGDRPVGPPALGTRFDLTDCHRRKYCSCLYYCQPCQGHYNDHIHIISVIFTYLTHWCVPREKYTATKMYYKFYGDKEPGPLSGLPIRNRQMAILKITASNIRKLVAKYLSAHLTPQASRRPPGYTSSKCSQEMSQCRLEKRAFGHYSTYLSSAETDYESHNSGDQKGEK